MTQVPNLAKSLFALAAGILLFTGAGPVAHAQKAEKKPQEKTSKHDMGCCSMMHGMKGDDMQQMHTQIMKSPHMRSAMQVHLLPLLKDSLSLTADQATRLEKAKSQYLKEQKVLEEKQRGVKEQLQKALKAEKPGLDTVQSLLSEQKKLETEEEMTLYRTAAQMKEELSEKQRGRFADLGPQEMHHAAMAHLSMQDMMRMMQGIHEECPMMENMGMGGMGMMEGMRGSMQGMEGCPMMGEDTMEENPQKGGEAPSPQQNGGEGNSRD